jgi:hypothetical protein
LEEWDMDTEAIEVGALTVGSMADGSRYKSEGQDNHRAALTWGDAMLHQKSQDFEGFARWNSQYATIIHIVE